MSAVASGDAGASPVASGFSRTERTESTEGTKIGPGTAIAASHLVSPRKLQRLKTFDYIGQHRYSLTLCTDARRELFVSERVVKSVLSQISRAAVEQDFAVIAYCFMPDHLHLLIEGLADTSDCKRFISTSKQYSGYCYSKQFHGRLWQRYAFERVLRNEELTLTIARYILENPIRAGLVKDVQDYPFVGSLRYDLDELLGSTSG